ncbi:MAG: uroporphyrinogen decarboxylase family protein [Verrucomicrobiota bacterium]
MTNRERVKAILHYEDCDRLPIVHFGYWRETLRKWADEGHIAREQAEGWADGNVIDLELSRMLGFDFNWYSNFHTANGILPGFECEVVAEFPDGSKHVRDGNGVVVLQKPGAHGIPPEIGHTLKDRASWEEHYKHRLRFSSERVDEALVNTGRDMVPFNAGGKEFLQSDDRDFHYGLFVGSLFGQIRDWLGVENTAYLYADDPDLFREIIDTSAELRFECAKYVLETGAKFDFAHFWEDICFKNGPLVSPSVFNEFVGPHYKRLTELVAGYGIDIVSVDCDGWIDSLIPTWLENGVNTMFPIEVGTWNASIAPWREQYGKELRGVGGMRKYVFAQDRVAVDAEVERLKPLVGLGGYIPCPDHRIAPDAEWDNVRYYCDKMHRELS